MVIANDQTPNADDVLSMSNIRQVYTGAGFNSSKTGGSGTDSQEHELDAVASAPDSNYCVVTITGLHVVNSSGISGNIKTTITVQIKETGGAYSTIDTGGLENLSIIGRSDTITQRFVVLLTAGQKTNGFQIKVLSSSITSNSSHTTSFTNSQTIQEVRT